MARFYICTRSNWQGDNWKPVAGPFATVTEANEQVDAHAYTFTPQTGGIDLKSEILARVFSRTELTRLGYPTSQYGEHDILDSIWDAQLDAEAG